MAKRPTPELVAARAAARNTDSAPSQPAPAAAGSGDAPAQKAIDTKALAASMPVNSNKALEHENHGREAPVGLHVSSPSRLPTGSTL